MALAIRPGGEPPTSFSFSAPGRSPQRLAGLAVVVLIHVVVLYALTSGLAQDVVRAIRPPLQTRLIEEARPEPPPPPPKKVVEAKPRNEAPPPPYVPPAEVSPPATAAPVIAVTSAEPVPAPPVAPPPPLPAPPRVVDVGVACANVAQVRQAVDYPDDALRLGVAGKVMVQFTVGAAGELRNLRATSSPHRSLTRAALEAARQLRCTGQGGDADVVFPFEFRLE